MALKSCCCGCSVKTGSLIVGYIYAVMSGVGIFLCILAMIVIGETDFSPYVPAGSEQDADRNINLAKGVLSKVYLLAAVICLKGLIVNCLLIHGIHRTKPALVLPWIIFLAAGMVVQTLMSYAAMTVVVAVPSAVWYSAMAFSVLVFGLETYILIVVSSHYHKMKKSSLLDEEEKMILM